MTPPTRSFRHLSILLVASALGCSAIAPETKGPAARCDGAKCDIATDVQASAYVIDMDRANEEWPDEVRAETPEDLMRVRVLLGGMEIIADTHIFGGVVHAIPYADGDDVTDAAGNPVARGDAVIAEYFPPGAIGIAVKHHRPTYRTLALEGGDPDTMKEHFKLQDTHIGIVVGIERDGQPGAITLNNPQTYGDGRFGDPSYPMVFLRPLYPEYLSASQQRAFEDNIRTMVLAFNAVSNFPGDYNGGDPLGARNPEELETLVVQMVRAIAGDREARTWFTENENLIYCAELAFVALSAGMRYPLNAETIVPLVGEEVWAAFAEELRKHNAGDDTTFTALNENPWAAYVEADFAPDGLRPSYEYAPTSAGADDQLAFQPFTVADIVEQFLATHMPRRELGEQLAPLQGAALTAMKPGLLEALSLDQVPLVTLEEIAVAPAESQPALLARNKIEMLFEQIVSVISTPFSSYEEFRSNIAPLMAEARVMTGPRDGSGTGLFVPPSMMHVVAQGRHPAGLLDLTYVAHGFHWSMVTHGGGAQGMALLRDGGQLAQGEARKYEITLPEGTSTLVVDMTTTSGDPDLYVQRGTTPTETMYECRPFSAEGENEGCTLEGAPGETFFVVVFAYTDAEFQVVASAR